MPGLTIDLHAALANKTEDDDNIIAFNNCDTLICKNTLSEHCDRICALEAYILDGK